MLHNVRYRGPVRPPPSREAIVETLGQLTMALFPAHYGKLGNGNGSVTPDMIDDFVAGVLKRALPELVEHLRGTLPFGCGRGAVGRRAVTPSAQHHARIRRHLAGDPRPAGERPAAPPMPAIPPRPATPRSCWCYPGMTAIIHHRLAHALHRLGAPLPRAADQRDRPFAHRHRHPSRRRRSAAASSSTTAPASSIGETAVIGERVRLYQAVTLGARSFPADETGTLIKGAAAPSDRRGRRRDLCRRHRARPHHRRPRLDHRRQRLADPQRAAQQLHHPGASCAATSPTARADGSGSDDDRAGLILASAPVSSIAPP